MFLVCFLGWYLCLILHGAAARGKHTEQGAKDPLTSAGSHTSTRRANPHCNPLPPQDQAACIVAAGKSTLTSVVRASEWVYDNYNCTVSTTRGTPRGGSVQTSLPRQFRQDDTNRGQGGFKTRIHASPGKTRARSRRNHMERATGWATAT